MLDLSAEVWLILENAQSMGFNGRVGKRGPMICGNKELAELVVSFHSKELVGTEKIAVKAAADVARFNGYTALHMLNELGSPESYSLPEFVRIR